MLNKLYNWLYVCKTEITDEYETSFDISENWWEMPVTYINQSNHINYRSFVNQYEVTNDHVTVKPCEAFIKEQQIPLETYNIQGNDSFFTKEMREEMTPFLINLSKGLLVKVIKKSYKNKNSTRLFINPVYNRIIVEQSTFTFYNRIKEFIYNMFGKSSREYIYKVKVNLSMRVGFLNE